MEVHLISVGGVYDDVIILRDSAGTVLIDGGRERADDHYSRTKKICEYLWAMGVDRLDYVIGSHLDENHVGVQGWLTDHIPIGTAFYPADPATCPEQWCEKATRVSLLHGADKMRIQVAQAGETHFKLGKMEVYFIGTRPEDFTATSNSISIVNYVRFGGNAFLFPGDLTGLGEETHMAHLQEDAAKFGIPSLKVDVVKWPHHGNAKLSEAFWAAAHPSLVLVPNNGKRNVPKSSGKRNLYRGDPTAELWMLSKYDTITLVSDGSRIDVYTNVDPSCWKR